MVLSSSVMSSRTSAKNGGSSSTFPLHTTPKLTTKLRLLGDGLINSLYNKTNRSISRSISSKSLLNLVSVDHHYGPLYILDLFLSPSKMDPLIRIPLPILPTLDFLHDFSTGREYSITSLCLQLSQALITHSRYLVK